MCNIADILREFDTLQLKVVCIEVFADFGLTVGKTVTGL